MSAPWKARRKDGVISGLLLYNPYGYPASTAIDVAVSGSTTYVVGATTTSSYSSSIPVLWSNGVPTVLTLPSGVTGSAAAYNIAVSGSTVYVVGSTVGTGWYNLQNAGTPLPPLNHQRKQRDGRQAVAAGQQYCCAVAGNRPQRYGSVHCRHARH